jgi:hypothetical protein
MAADDDATAIRDVFEHEGELSAAIEVRRRFPHIGSNETARSLAREVAGWKSQPTQEGTVTKLVARKRHASPTDESLPDATASRPELTRRPSGP